MPPDTPQAEVVAVRCGSSSSLHLSWSLQLIRRSVQPCPTADMCFLGVGLAIRHSFRVCHDSDLLVLCLELFPDIVWARGAVLAGLPEDCSSAIRYWLTPECLSARC